MNPRPLPGVPVLSCEEARRFEATLFAGDEGREWAAMVAAGRGVGEALLRDVQEIGGLPPHGTLLVLVGKGHNGGDALLAAAHVLEAAPGARAEVCFALGERALRPLARRAWDRLWQSHASRVRIVAPRDVADAGDPAPAVVLDGIFGFNYRPPLAPDLRDLIHRVNTRPARMRVAVDLPTGAGEDIAFRADFTYATGAAKAPLLASPSAGRLRLIDLGWKLGEAFPTNSEWVLDARILAPLGQWRNPRSDKRDYGHVFVVGGSRSFPGAVLMCVQAALMAGAGLLTAFVPESLAPAFAARCPEAMWVGCPETPDGALALDLAHALRQRWDRADALVIGPGLGREPETLAWLSEVVENAPCPLVLDADALQPSIVTQGAAHRIVTPHAGELARIASDSQWPVARHSGRLTLVEKGPVTWVHQGDRRYAAFAGGPVLARGGSGDMLAGIAGTLLAQAPAEPALAAARAVLWHGQAADHLARRKGQVSVQSTQLLESLGPVLREAADEDLTA